jgi:hypothetical protein
MSYGWMSGKYWAMSRVLIVLEALLAPSILALKNKTSIDILNDHKVCITGKILLGD